MTIYGISTGGPNRQIFTAGCVPPGSTKEWTTRGHSYVSLSGIYWIRAEMTRKPDCQRPPVDCDTTMEVQPDRKTSPEYLLRANATNCWWQKKTK